MIKAINYGIVNDIFNPDDVETMIDMSNALYYKITMAGNIASEPMCGIL
jgi:hypothetical protein